MKLKTKTNEQMCFFTFIWTRFENASKFNIRLSLFDPNLNKVSAQ